jgi:hypothetical protein
MMTAHMKPETIVLHAGPRSDAGAVAVPLRDLTNPLIPTESVFRAEALLIAV